MGRVKISGLADGIAAAPPSKSIAHRLLICSFLAGGGTVYGVSESEDMRATICCLRSLGCNVGVKDGTATLYHAKPSGEPLMCNESGSTLRFMVPVCLLYDYPFTLCGTKRLFSRSLEVYEELCRSQGITFEQREDSLFIKGRLKGGHIKVRGDISSQFISGLLFVLPVLDTDSTIEITGSFESAPYVDMTIQALGEFGVTAVRCGNIIDIPGNQHYTRRSSTVEGDWSNAAFLDALSVVGGNVKVTNLNTDSLQGDKIYREYFKKIQNGYTTLDIADCPDLGPILIALGAANKGVRLTGTKRLAIKESDRGTAMAKELEKFGISVLNEKDSITVPCGLKPPCDVLDGHNDHRIVMSLAVLLTKYGGVIEGYEAVNKSFPDFFKCLERLGVKVEYEA